MDTKSLWRSTWGSVRRGVVGSMAAVLFGAVILATSILAASNPLKVKPFDGELVQANPVMEDNIKIELMMEPSVTPTPSEPAKVEYYLPYPGMLPDNPLYRLKALRDMVRLRMTFDELKKAEMQLAYADKRINAAMFLMDGSKQELAVSTATKAEKYLEQSVAGAIKMNKDGKDVKSLLLTLSKASAKHYELLSSMQTRSDASWQDVLSKTKEGTKNLQSSVAQALMESK